MNELRMNGSKWKSADNFYDALFRVLGAPQWHGRNFNALRESLAEGDINSVEPPFRIVITGGSTMGEGARQVTQDFKDLIEELTPELVKANRFIELEIT